MTTPLFTRFCLILLFIVAPCSVNAFSQQPSPKSAKAEVASSETATRRVFVSTPAREIRRLVSDCMTPRNQLHVLKPDTTTDEAIVCLLTYGISGAPVINPTSGKLVGVISSSDFILKDYAGALIDMEVGDEETLNGIVEVARKIVGTTVEELMSRQVVTIRSTEPMAYAADIMARRNLHRLIVVDPDDEDELVGILTRSDVMRDVMSTVRAALPEHATLNDDNNNDNKNEDTDSELQP